MKCNCCDAELAEKEIVWNEDLRTWELCSVCLSASLDAAYSQGFTIDDEAPVLETGWDDYTDILYVDKGVSCADV